MKVHIGLLSLIIISFSCIPQKGLIIESDYSFEGSFRNYKTYAFVSNYFEEGDINHLLVPVFEKLITQRLESQGYESTGKNPDLLINYKFYVEDIYLMASSQPKLKQWIKSVDLEVCGNPVDLCPDYKLYEQKLNKGTVLVTLYDPKKGLHVWQGYASGFLGKKNEPDLNYLRLAVNKIFDEYRVLARGFSASIR